MWSSKNGSSNADPPMVAATIPSYGAVVEPVTVTYDEPTPVPVMASEATPLVVTDDNAAGHFIESEDETKPVFRDVPFAIIFLVQIVVMLWLGVGVAPAGLEVIQFNFTTIEEALRKNDDDGITEENIQQFEQIADVVTEFAHVYPVRILLYLVVPCCLLAFVFAYVITAFVLKTCPKPLVYASLLGSLAGTAAVMIASSIASNTPFVYMLTVLSIGGVAYYISIVWKMVPFAAVNLKVALEGISRNCGMYVVACLFAELGFCWVLYWLYVVVGVSAYQTDQCQNDQPNVDPDELGDDCGPPFPVVLLFLLSLYWTSTALMNTVQVTVAGVMATWCFDKDAADGCCSSAVFSSLFRSMTYSFGSICFGSLLQALISVLRYVLESSRNQREQEGRRRGGCGAIFLCVLECIARWLEDIIEYFNQWAYVFVGIYGYSYLESGRRVMELFRARGWTSIVTNGLVSYVLGFATFTVGIVTGVAALMVEYIATQRLGDQSSEFESYVFGPVPGWRFVAFGIGFLVGIWVSSVLMNVVKGAVNTLIVCWADSPAVFELNHPALTTEMTESWRSVFPEAIVQLRPAYNAVVV